MVPGLKPLSDDVLTSPDENMALHKKTLALDALSKLAQQFSNRPDFHELIDVLLLTLSGQLTAVNTFAAFYRPGAVSAEPVYFGTGKFKKNVPPSLALDSEQRQFLQRSEEPLAVESLKPERCMMTLADELAAFGAKLIVPLVHKDELIGILGSGPRVSGKPFEETDIHLLTTLTHTVTPFISNSFHFVEIAQLNTWYLDILNSVKQGVFVFDHLYRLKKVNAPAMAILRDLRHDSVAVESLLHQPVQEVFPDDLFHDWSHRIRGGSSEIDNLRVENMAAGNGEQERIFKVYLGCIQREQDINTDLVVTVEDVTEQTQSERRLFELEKFSEKGEMAASISHELNNYLGMVLGGVELTTLALERGNMEKAAETLGKLKHNVISMERFTAGLTDYSKVTSGDENADLNGIVTETLSFLTLRKKFQKIKIRTDFDHAIPSLDMNTGHVSQLLLNLLNNAADAIEEANRQAGQITVSTSLEANRVILTVSDNGVGITPEVREKLFKTQLTTKAKGHGHGLVTCARLIGESGGEIDLETEPGAGTAFTVTFPVGESIPALA